MIFTPTSNIQVPFMQPQWRRGRASPGGVLVEDAFTDSNGTPLASHTISPINTTGNNWFESSLGVEVQSNTAIGSSVGGACQAVIECGISDCTVSCDLIAPNAMNFFGALISRFTDDNNYWAIGTERDASTPYVFRRKIVGGAVFSNQTYFDNSIAGRTVPLKIVFLGSAIDFYIDGILVDSLSDSFNVSATMYGILADYASPYIDKVAFDNFKVEN